MTSAIESNPRDNGLRRLATFVATLAMFAFFLIPILLIVGFNKMTGKDDAVSPIVEGRAQILEDTRNEQAIVNEYGAIKDGKISMAIADVLPISAARLITNKGQKTDLVIPGSPTALKGVDTGGEYTELLEVLAAEENKK